MKKIKSVLTYSGTLLMAYFGYFYPCFSQSGPFPTVTQKSVKLEYNIPAGGVKYLNTSKVLQTMDINGQSMEANVYSSLGCSIKPAGIQDGNLKLEVMIDTAGQSTESPQGYIGGAIPEVVSKTFNITISPSGKEIDISEAAKIGYNIEGSGQSDLSQSFSDFFPDLPEASVSPGYTWTTTDTINTKTPAMTMLMIIKSENRFDGLETVDGIACAKIISTLSGTRDMKLQSQGNDIRMSGPFTGTGTLLFSAASGYFIKHTVTTTLKGTLEITYPEAMSFPLLQEMNSVNEIVK